MARKKQTAEEASKSRLMARGRKLMKDVQRYGSLGYVTNREDHEEDDRRLIKAIDGLYDSARKLGVGEDLELQAYRLELRQAWSGARRAAIEARISFHQGETDRLRAMASGRNDEIKRHLEDWNLSEARRRLAKIK